MFSMKDWARLDAEEAELDRIEELMKTTQGRYLLRAEKWNKKNFGEVRHYFWWVVHNSVVHPLLGILPCKTTFKMHDWASKKLSG